MKCEECKHVCYDEPVITCNHPKGFGADGECPLEPDATDDHSQAHGEGRLKKND